MFFGPCLQSAARILPFRSISPKRMKILDWYLQGWCIRGKVCIVVIWPWPSDLWPWPSDLELEIHFRSVSPERIQILDWYCRDDVLGDKGVSCGVVTFDLGPVTFDPEIPFCSVFPKWLQGWCTRGQMCVMWIIATWQFPFNLPDRMQILDWYLQGWYIRGQRYVAVTFHLCPTY
jgi:hypothetical protein